MVLLKNQNSLLPLSRTEKIAVVGLYVDSGNVGDRGSSRVVCRDGVTPYAGLLKKFQDVASYNGLDSKRALETAVSADVVIVCVGCDSKDEGEFLINVGKKMSKKPRYAIDGDRDHLYLNPSHLELLKVLKQAGKKVIAVLYTGNMILTEKRTSVAS